VWLGEFGAMQSHPFYQVSAANQKNRTELLVLLGKSKTRRAREILSAPLFFRGWAVVWSATSDLFRKIIPFIVSGLSFFCPITLELEEMTGRFPKLVHMG
jgi:hypothetical protein